MTALGWVLGVEPYPGRHRGHGRGRRWYTPAHRGLWLVTAAQLSSSYQPGGW